MELIAYECSACGFAAASSLSGGMYAVDDQGVMVPCVHPGEFATAAEVLGITREELDSSLRRNDAASTSKLQPAKGERERWLDELVTSRLRFKVGCCCFDCCTHSEVDASQQSRSCPQCGSPRLHTPVECLGLECPRCHAGTIREVDTGIRF